MNRIAGIAVVAAALVAVSVGLAYFSPVRQASPGPSPPDGSNAGGDYLPARFEEAINLTNNTQDSVYGQVVASNETVYVVWQDSVAAPGSQGGKYSSRNYDIFMSKSEDSGKTFSPPVNLSNNPGFSEHPQASASKHGVYVVWADDSSGNREVMFSRISASGPDLDVMNLSNNVLDSFNQEIAIHEDYVYVVWLETGADGNRVVLRASSDGGETFGEQVIISENAGSATLPKVAADGRSVHVAWSVTEDRGSDGLYHSASDDAGSRFSVEKKIGELNEFGEPQVVARNNRVYVISGGYEDIEVDGLLLAKSFDGGATFTAELIDGNGSFVNPLNVEAAVGRDDSLLYVAGQVFVSGDEEIILMPLRVETNGTKVLGLADLSSNDRTSECPSIAVSGSGIFVVWEDLSPGNHEILYARGQEV